jgi:hypothetical protein
MGRQCRARRRRLQCGQRQRPALGRSQRRPAVARHRRARWIEEIPFSETRNYVQRVIENAVVYDMIDPKRPSARGEQNRFYISASARRG